MTDTEAVDGALAVLARQLSCSLCGAPFTSQPCSPTHEAVQANVRNHRLIKPLLAEAWDECVDLICSPDESGTANNARFKRANPYAKDES